VSWQVRSCQNGGMIGPDALAEWVLEEVPKKVPGRAIAVIALALYPGVGLALPIAFAWSTPWLVNANLFGVIFSASMCLGWLLLQSKLRDRRHLLEWTSDLRLLDAKEFEWLVGEVFRREGWAVEETGRQGGPDGNIDLRLRRPGEQRLVQCKRWTSRQPGVAEIREFAGTLSREHLPATAGVFVTLSTFHDQARDEAMKLGLALLEGRDLIGRMEKVRQTEPCPKCESPMLVDRSATGWWLRCPRYPNCDGKRDLSRDEAQAVRLLTREG
jgi:hypothetical protein